MIYGSKKAEDIKKIMDELGFQIRWYKCSIFNIGSDQPPTEDVSYQYSGTASGDQLMAPDSRESF